MIAYVDTSWVVAIAHDEPGAASLAKRLTSYEQLASSNLLEAELRSVLARDTTQADPEDLLSGIVWAYPDRPLTSEFAIVLQAGYIRGADLWHLAVALYVDPRREITFLTLDERQKAVAHALKFPT